jgi:hypothetical protein
MNVLSMDKTILSSYSRSPAMDLFSTHDHLL